MKFIRCAIPSVSWRELDTVECTGNVDFISIIIDFRTRKSLLIRAMREHTRRECEAKNSFLITMLKFYNINYLARAFI